VEVEKRKVREDMQEGLKIVGKRGNNLLGWSRR
jgi:hypothetical protein